MPWRPPRQPQSEAKEPPLAPEAADPRREAAVPRVRAIRPALPVTERRRRASQAGLWEVGLPQGQALRPAPPATAPRPRAIQAAPPATVQRPRAVPRLQPARRVTVRGARWRVMPRRLRALPRQRLRVTARRLPVMVAVRRLGLARRATVG